MTAPAMHWTPADGAPLVTDADGWYFARCQCGFEQGPFVDTAQAIDALMEHAYERGFADGRAASA